MSVSRALMEDSQRFGAPALISLLLRVISCRDAFLIAIPDRHPSLVNPLKTVPIDTVPLHAGVSVVDGRGAERVAWHRCGFRCIMKDVSSCQHAIGRKYRGHRASAP